MIVLGRILAPFGVKGWVRIQPFGDDPETCAVLTKWWLARAETEPEDGWKAVAVRTCQVHGSSLIAQLEGIEDRSRAEGLKGWLIGAPRSDLPEAGENEYYWADLVGLQVENLAGEALGTVEGLLSTGAHDVLRVVDGESERLIPFVAAYAHEVDLAERRIRVDWQKDW